LQSFLQFRRIYGSIEGAMKYILCFFIGSPAFSSIVMAFTGGNIGSVNYTLSPEEFFPTPRDKVTTDNGIENVTDYLISFIPFLTTLIVIFATLMVILGGFYMVLGGASSEQTEKGKSVVKDALMGVAIGLLAYVIIVTL
jgi:hypothetical protein